MKARTLTLLLSLAFLGFSVSAFAGKPNCAVDNTHPSCSPDPEPDGTPEYSARLTTGDFVFHSGTLDGLIAQKKGTSLPSNGTLEMDLTITTVESFYYFGDCSDLVPGGVQGFDVLSGSWWISYTSSNDSPGNIHITMRNLVMHPAPPAPYGDADFDFDLHGVLASGKTFLPAGVSQTSTHTLKEYKLWAGINGKGGFTCNSDGRLPLAADSTLVITRTK